MGHYRRFLDQCVNIRRPLLDPNDASCPDAAQSLKIGESHPRHRRRRAGLPGWKCASGTYWRHDAQTPEAASPESNRPQTQTGQPAIGGPTQIPDDGRADRREARPDSDEVPAPPVTAYRPSPATFRRWRTQSGRRTQPNLVAFYSRAYPPSPV